MAAERIETKSGTYWRFVVRFKSGFVDAEAERLKADIVDLGVSSVERVQIAQVFYLKGNLSNETLTRMGELLLADPITQEYEVASSAIRPPRNDREVLTVEVAYLPGVRDPVEDSLKKGALDLGITGLEEVHTAKEYTLTGSLEAQGLERVCEKLLVNPTIQHRVTPESLQRLLNPPPIPTVPIETVHLVSASDTVLQRVSIDHSLSLNLEEMRAIQAYFRKEAREPTLIELQTLAQTWSEHCKHKTFRGSIVYTEEVDGKATKRVIDHLFKSTIMKATEELQSPWCVSVFVDNAGVIAFDEVSHVCFKVETHNHPSALEPFGGASTGIGGVIRDILGTGLGASPIASTDIFCFAPPDFPLDRLPPGILHPRRVMNGVVAGVKDYGNKMGIPTVNGAVLFDERFLGNPLVYCGNVGLLPKDKVAKRVVPGTKVVLIGGRTGRDGIHGATFSSLALTAESESISATAVQIGDPITEKKLRDALLEARDQDLYTSVTDCGAGGLSSAVGEMGASCGARVDLEKVPLKYAGLTATEIWISESQERMVLAVPPENLDRLIELIRQHDTLATAVGEFTDSGKLELFYQGVPVGTLQMEFLHHGVPQIHRPARWKAPTSEEPSFSPPTDLTQILLKLLGSWDICSKEWIIRQYDHEVQGGSALKPLVGRHQRGPSDAAIVRPRLDSNRGIILANGINFRYGDLDPYGMAVLNIEEAIRQVVAVGGSLDHLAILDNFCWGDPTRPEVLGSLVRAALGCYDAAKAYGTPFISGKDSLHNEFRIGDQTIQIPGTLLISAIGVIPDVRQAISMDAKRAGNGLYAVGLTKAELGGSAYYTLQGLKGGKVPQADLAAAPRLLKVVSQAIAQGLVVSAHDCSEGGLAVAAAEMAFAGDLGLVLNLKAVPGTEGTGTERMTRDDTVLFSESPTRLLLEVPPEKSADFEKALSGFPVARIGEFRPDTQFQVLGLHGKPVMRAAIETLQSAWEAPFKGW